MIKMKYRTIKRRGEDKNKAKGRCRTKICKCEIIGVNFVIVHSVSTLLALANDRRLFRLGLLADFRIASFVFRIGAIGPEITSTFGYKKV